MFKVIFALLIGSHLTVFFTGGYSLETWNSHNPTTNVPRIEDYEFSKYFSKDLLKLKEIEQI